MSTTMKTPGVYIQELDAFGNSVVPVATAVPAFIGYTEKTSFNGKSLVNNPVKITSLAQFQSIFEDQDQDKRPKIKFSIDNIASVNLGGRRLFVDKSSPANTLGVAGDLYFDQTKIYTKDVNWSPAGADVLTGTTAPTSSDGADGNYYIDTKAEKWYGPRKGGEWPKTTFDLLTGKVAPDKTVGEPGAFYYDTAAKKTYGPAKAAWSTGVNVLKGTAAPTDEGAVGNYFFDTSAVKLYGPKKGGEWPKPIGTVISSTKAPTANDGGDGAYFIDTVKKKVYGPRAGDTWPEITNPAIGTKAPTESDGAPTSYYVDTTENLIYGPKGKDTWPQSGYDVSPQPADYEYAGTNYYISNVTRIHRLHSAMRFFYANGGGDCYVLSVGKVGSDLDANDVTGAIDLLKKEAEPTMLVIPDVVEFSLDEAYSIQGYMINHCGAEMPSRVAILDIPNGYNEPEDNPTASVDVFRDRVSGTVQKSNSYAAAYYPWLHTTVYQSADVSYKNLIEDSYANVATLLTTEFTDPVKGISVDHANAISSFTNKGMSDDGKLTIDEADAALQNLSKQYPILLGKVKRQLNLMAPSAAMAGIYTAVDNADGVWKAPANVAVQNVTAPAVKINNDMQENLNVPLNGKSVCAIRFFKGMGNMVWGARTLDGNSNDWRYVNVRRTLIFLEQSIKEAAKTYVFAPNDANTWVTVKSMISNFLTGVWKQGGLVGPKPADAYSVSVGLGTTMTNEDIQLGIMRVMVKVAVSHPAEFIEITFQQQMQKA
ncbi:phage tail sheath family protein [Pukyongia salina]|nr:phage tail sheath C-terminal domain-containing protein [Pukyongia salina]